MMAATKDGNIFMKTNILHRAVAVGVGAALLFAVSQTSADEPKPKRRAKTEKAHTEKPQAEHSTTTAKPVNPNNGRFPTADGRNSTSADGHGVGGATAQETRVPTGSLIPRTYQRRGYTTDSQDNSFIYDQNDIRLRSTNTVQDSLRTVPGLTISGPR